MLKKKTKEFVELGVLTSGGAAIMGGMGQGEIGASIASPVAKMMPATISASYGVSIMAMADKYSKKKKPMKFKKGKHIGYGEY